VIDYLTVRNLLKDGRLARSVSDAAWTDLSMVLEYKCARFGRELVVIDCFLSVSGHATAEPQRATAGIPRL